MRWNLPARFGALAALSLWGCGLTLNTTVAQEPAAGAWKKTVVDPVFHSEGVTAADVNKDGKIDILTGENWYEAPTATGCKDIPTALPAGQKTSTKMAGPT